MAKNETVAAMALDAQERARMQELKGQVEDLDARRREIYKRMEPLNAQARALYEQRVPLAEGLSELVTRDLLSAAKPDWARMMDSSDDSTAQAFYEASVGSGFCHAAGSNSASGQRVLLLMTHKNRPGEPEELADFLQGVIAAMVPSEGKVAFGIFEHRHGEDGEFSLRVDKQGPHAGEIVRRRGDKDEVMGSFGCLRDALATVQDELYYSADPLPENAPVSGKGMYHPR